MQYGSARSIPLPTLCLPARPVHSPSLPASTPNPRPIPSVVPQAILASEGLVLPADSPGLDRDSLLDALDKNIARTFVQCDPT